MTSSIIDRLSVIRWVTTQDVFVQRLRPRIIQATIGILVAALLFTIGGRLMLNVLERQLIYFPARVNKDSAVPQVDGAASVEEIWLETDDGVRVHGLYVSRDGAVAELLFFHGNAGNLYDRLDNVSLLVRSGFSVLILDYRGYGKSAGQPSELGLYADGRAAYRYMTQERRVDPARLVLFGRSLGATVAIELGREQAVGAVIVESGFTSAQDLARLHYSWIPKLVIRSMTHEFASIAKVADLRAPALYVHGESDSIVPAQMGRQLFEASAEPREWYGIKGAGHNDTWLVAGAAYFQRLIDFVELHSG